MPPLAPPPEPSEAGWVDDEDVIGSPFHSLPDVAEDADAIQGNKATWGEEPAEKAAAVVAGWPDVFLRLDGSALTWVDDRGRPGMQPLLSPVEPTLLRGLMNARRMKFTEREKIPAPDGGKATWGTRRVPPPAALVERIVSTRPGEAWRVIEGIAPASYMLASGEVVSEPGYRDGLWLSRSGRIDVHTLPDVSRIRPEGYSPEEAADAAEAMLFDLGGIEWATPGDRSAALAYYLTLITRPAYRLCPIFLFTAPLSGSGKDLVAKCWENAAFGYEALRITPPPGRADDSSTELDKRISSAVLAGESTIVIGDARRILSPMIYGLTTEERAPAGRELGVSKTISAPRNLTLVGVGNNPELGIDVVRRAVSIRIVPKTQRPAERKFELSEDELIQRYRANRGPFFGAAVNIVRGALKANRPRSERLACSFAGWSRMVQAACIYAGLPDPLESREALARRVAGDDASTLLAPLMAAWWSMRGSLRATATQACAPLAQGPTEDLAIMAYREALQALDQKLDPRKLGTMLSAAEDCPFTVTDAGGETLTVKLHVTKPGNVTNYALIKVS